MKQITKEKLQELYETKTNAEVCKKLGICNITLVKYLKSAGIKLKGRGKGKNNWTKIIII